MRFARIRALVFYLLIFASSVVELAYEVLWMRRLALIFGATSTAAAITLAAIFLGMTMGSAVFGRWVCRWQNPLRLFAWLELALALSAAVVEPTLGFYDTMVFRTYPWLSGQPGMLLLLESALSFIATLLPAFFLGGLLPVAGVAQASSSKPGKGQPSLGGLYGSSLVGAALGTLLVPIVLLPYLGASSGYRAVLLVNLGLAAIVWWQSCTRRGPAMAPPAQAAALPVSTNQSAISSLTWLAFFSGFATLALEVLWARMLSMVHENSTHSFAVVLAVFLLGLGAGAGVARLVSVNVRWAVLVGGLAPVIAGAMVILSPRLFQTMTSGMAYTPGAGDRTIPAGGLISLALSFLFPGATLAGLVFPLLLDVAKRRHGTTAFLGKALGRLVAANTAGAVAGPLVAAFVLLPLAGLWWSIAAVGVLLAALGVATGYWLRKAEAPVSASPGALDNVKPPWRWKLLFGALSTAALALLVGDPGGVPRVRFDPGRGQELIAIVDGVHGTLAVLQDQNSRWVTFNNHYTLGGTASTGDERQQGHLPLLLHPAPRTAAFLGLGTGITAGAALLHPLERLTVLEILPEAVEAARDHFAHANYNLVKDSRVEVVVGDARAFIRCSGRRFDVIVGDLVTPWRPGESLLYSQEHFDAARRALEPGGLYCQWLPLFQLTEEGFNIITATFLDVFPDATLWRGDFLPDQPALALIGTGDGHRLDPKAATRRSSELASRLDHTNPYLADPAGLWLFLVGPLNPRDPSLEKARRNRDAHPWLELMTPLTQREFGAEDNALRLAPLVGARLKPILDKIQSLPVAGSWLERLGAEELRLRDLGAALWHASLLARQQSWEESGKVARRALAKLPQKLQLAVTGQIVEDGEPESNLPR